MVRTLSFVLFLGAAASAAHADEWGELEFSELAAAPDHITVRACSFNKTDDETFEQWTNVTVLLFENQKPSSAAADSDSALSQEVVMSLVYDAEIEHFCGNGVIGKDENCGSGQWTQAWARCAYDVMRAIVKPVPLSKFDRTRLLQLGQSTSCGKIVVDHHYECSVSVPAQ